MANLTTRISDQYIHRQRLSIIAQDSRKAPQTAAMNPEDENSNTEAAVEGIRPSILVVEDVRMIHEVIERTLRGLDAKYSVAGDGLTALEMIEEEVPDLVILDLALPILSGWEVLHRLRANDRTADVPVLVMTAHGQSGLEQEVMSLGANAYLDKPFQPKKLRVVVHELLGLS